MIWRTLTTLLSKQNDQTSILVHNAVQAFPWRTDDSLNATDVKFASILLSYNIFTNAVHQFDKLGASDIRTAKKSTYSQVIFTFQLATSAFNKLSLYYRITLHKNGFCITEMQMENCWGYNFP